MLSFIQIFILMGKYSLWSVQSVVSTVCGQYSLWSVQSVVSTVCGQYSLWSVQSVVSTVCGQYSLWSTLCFSWLPAQPVWRITFTKQCNLMQYNIFPS